MAQLKKLKHWKELENNVYYNETKDAFVQTWIPHPSDEYLNKFLKKSREEQSKAIEINEGLDPLNWI